ncbi:cbb3-type cytochrome oxidase assembly protein CcoS [Thalassotalea aquiviva]|uniref:cbb3-type cytochrome oxidase assembly protein CcoS n=1 Tax=Thalassotalea aquiviva TaxID=3242415 RepID=UPI00352B0CB0
MSVIYILIPIAILFTALAIYLFFWAVKTEQFDDLEKQGMSILFDEDKTAKKHSKKHKQPDAKTTEHQHKSNLEESSEDEWN